jgi:hypothetical protein
MEAVADAIMQRFSTQLSTVLVSLTQTLERTMEKMESIRQDLSHLNTMGYDNKSQSGVPNILDDEIRDIREKMRRLSLSCLQYVTTDADLSEDHDSRRY